MCEYFGMIMKFQWFLLIELHKDYLNIQKEADKRGIRVIIAGAGGAAHLPGMVAQLHHFQLLVFLLKLHL